MVGTSKYVPYIARKAVGSMHSQFVNLVLENSDWCFLLLLLHLTILSIKKVAKNYTDCHNYLLYNYS